MRTLIRISTLACAFVLTSCSPSTPQCGDPQVVETAEGILNKPLVKAGVTNSRIRFKAMRTVSVDSESDRRVCAAEVYVDGAMGKELTEQLQLRGQNQVQYTVEVTDDGGFYITVYDQ